MDRSKHFYDEIACAAYELYEKRGKLHGNHLEDWLDAEKIVMERHVKEIESEAKIIAAGRKRSAPGAAKPKTRKPAAKKSAGPGKRTTKRKKTE